MENRKGAITFKNKPITLIGPEIKVGQKAPDFTLLDSNMKEVSSSQSKGKVKLLSVVYSLDTPVCDVQTQTFEQEASKFPNVVVYSISMDLPYAAARYSKERHIKRLNILSDYKDGSFGKAYGLLIKESKLLARAVFIIDTNDIVRYVEYVKDVTEAPDYKKAIEALNNVVHECLDV